MKQDAESASVQIVKVAATFAPSRKLLNAVYIRLSSPERRAFHSRFAKIFRYGHLRPSAGVWKIVFHGKTILMPLTENRFWLDWDSAISIVGNDLEVKETYQALIASTQRPMLFLDIGANYGTHSLLFLVHGIEAISFEPNSSCHPFIRTVCSLNQVSPSIEAVALGDSEGYAELSYPERDTWLGTINPIVKDRLQSRGELATQRVVQRTVDQYFPRMKDRRVLIKIDTEGNELAVLRGAEMTLRHVKPLIIFESLPDEAERAKVNGFFLSHQYVIHGLPWSPSSSVAPLISEHFQASSSTNFIAIPQS